MTIPAHIAEAVVDPKAYADWDRSHEAFAWLRKNAPLDVAEIDADDGRPGHRQSPLRPTSVLRSSRGLTVALSISGFAHSPIERI